jgi:hypothetical protein
MRVMSRLEESIKALVLAAIIAITLLIYSLFVIGPLLWPLLLGSRLIKFQEAMMDSPYIQIACLVGLVALGILYFRIRLLHKSLYGAAEFIIGITSCWLALENLKGLSENESAIKYTLPVAAGLYIIVRGCDNMYSSYADWKKELEDMKGSIRYFTKDEAANKRDASGFLLPHDYTPPLQIAASDNELRKE